jgi:hypothetical protein
VNVTAVAPTESGHVRLYPWGTSRPPTATVNYAAGTTRANNAVVSMGAEGAVTVFVKQPSGTAHLAIDVNGYFE